MASIVKRKDSWSVVYYYKDETGKRKQKWEKYSDEASALKRKEIIEIDQSKNTFQVPTATTLIELINDYVEFVGKDKWAHSTYSGNMGLINNYIAPIIGDTKLHDINKAFIRNYYHHTLLNTPAITRKGRYEERLVSPSIVREIHKILNPALSYGTEYDYIVSNPAKNISLPKVIKKKRDIWEFETFKKACDLCDNEQLDAIMHLSFSCSLRIGEILGLKWDDVNISEEAIDSKSAFIDINKQLQRASLKSIETLKKKKKVTFIFPPVLANSQSRIILIDTKTESSQRIVWLPKSVSKKLIRIREIQNSWKNILGDDYTDYNQVFTKPDGNPTLTRVVEKWFDDLINRNNLPKVVFHSLRHTSTTYKLRLFKDIKAVQGDTGHSQSKMVTDVYSHILDEDRRTNAELFEQEFYQKDTSDSTDTDKSEDQEKLLNLINEQPELAKQLLSLMKSMTGHND